MSGTDDPTYTVTVADIAEQHTAVVRGHVPYDAVGDFLGEAYGETAGAVEHQDVHATGVPFGRYRVTENGLDVEAGIPVSAAIRPMGRVEASMLPGGHVARTVHRGAYEAVAKAYAAVEAWLVENSYEPADAPWESYLDDPTVPEPRTEVFYPCRPAHR